MLPSNKTGFLVVLITASVAQSVFAQIQPTPQREITIAREQSNVAFRIHNIQQIKATMTQKITVVTASGVVVHGRDSVGVLLARRFAATPGLIYERKPEQIVIAQSDTLAWERGRWTATINDKASARGNYAAAWCKRNGQWLIRSELFVALD